MWEPFCAYQAIARLRMPAAGMDPRDTAVCYWGMDCLHVAVNLGRRPMMETEYAGAAGPADAEHAMPDEVVVAAAAAVAVAVVVAAAPVDGETVDPRIPSFSMKWWCLDPQRKRYLDKTGMGSACPPGHTRHMRPPLSPVAKMVTI